MKKASTEEMLPTPEDGQEKAPESNSEMEEENASVINTEQDPLSEADYEEQPDDAEYDAESVDGSDPDDSPLEQEKAKATPKKKISADTAKSPSEYTGKIVSMGEHMTVETAEKKKENKRLELKASMKSGKILRATINGVERAENGLPYVSLLYGDVKVIIPAKEVLDVPRWEDETDIDYYARLELYLKKRVGSDTPFLVKSRDENGNIIRTNIMNKKVHLIAASRLDAMRILRRHYFRPNVKTGKSIVEVGKPVQAQVVSVNQRSIILYFGGIETRLRPEEISYSHIGDLTTRYFPGTRVLAKVTAIERTPQGLQVSVSMKDMEENPYDAYAWMYNTQGCYVGQVEDISDNGGVFVSLGGNLTCLCPLPSRCDIPVRGSKVSIVITFKDDERKHLAGRIIHVSSLDME